MSYLIVLYTPINLGKEGLQEKVTSPTSIIAKWIRINSSFDLFLLTKQESRLLEKVVLLEDVAFGKGLFGNRMLGCGLCLCCRLHHSNVMALL